MKRPIYCFHDQLEFRYNTVVGEQGLKMSGGGENIDFKNEIFVKNPVILQPRVTFCPWSTFTFEKKQRGEPIL